MAAVTEPLPASVCAETSAPAIAARNTSRDFGPGITAVRVRAAEFLGGPWRALPMAGDLLLDALRAPELSVRLAAAQSLVELRRAADGSVGSSTFDLVRPIRRNSSVFA